MKKLILALAFVGAAPAALAQPVNVVPQVGVITTYQNTILKQSYRASSVGLAPAASATDIFCITGSATKTIKITKFRVSGTAGTLVTAPVYVAFRIAADTAGTLASNLALPVASKLDTGNDAATAVLAAYTANPTIGDTSPEIMASGWVTLPVTSAGVATVPLEFTFGGFPWVQPLTLRGAAQQACLNLNGVSVSSGLLGITVEWYED